MGAQAAAAGTLYLSFTRLPRQPQTLGPLLMVLAGAEAMFGAAVTIGLNAGRIDLAALGQ